jgi:hypothetical protein
LETVPIISKDNVIEVKKADAMNPDMKQWFYPQKGTEMNKLPLYRKKQDEMVN